MARLAIKLAIETITSENCSEKLLSEALFSHEVVKRESDAKMLVRIEGGVVHKEEVLKTDLLATELRYYIETGK